VRLFIPNRPTPIGTPPPESGGVDPPPPRLSRRRAAEALGHPLTGFFFLVLGHPKRVGGSPVFFPTGSVAEQNVGQCLLIFLQFCPHLDPGLVSAYPPPRAGPKKSLSRGCCVLLPLSGLLCPAADAGARRCLSFKRHRCGLPLNC